MTSKAMTRLLGTIAALAVISSTAMAEEPFRIGSPASLSGKFVAFGAQVKKGVETAVEVWKNVRGGKVDGRDIEVVVRDTQSNPSVTVSVMNELMQSDKSDVLVGPGASNIGAAAVPPWRQNPNHPIWIVPGVSTTVVEKEVAKDPYFFHTFAWTYHYHSTNAAAMKASIGTGKKVAIIYSDGAYGRSHIEAARKYLKEAGYNIVGEELIRENAPDFTPSILKIRAMHPDIIYTLVQTTDAVVLAKQIYSAKLDVPYLIGTAQAILPEWKNAVGDVQECWTGVATWMPGLTYAADSREPKLFPSSADWEAMWRAKYKKEPEYMEVGAYVSTMLALLAVEKSHSTDRDKLRAALDAQDYQTPLGNSKFAPSEISLQQAFSEMVVFQQQKQPDGKFKSVIIYPKNVAQGKLEKCKS
jgi:branched-chain amino acid transport system substrate-binding protein